MPIEVRDTVPKFRLPEGSPGWLADDEFGSRARLGLVTPSRGWTIEHEWPRMLPKGVAFLTSRMPLDATTPEALMKMGEHAVSAAKLLASASVDLICYGCTVESILHGLKYEKELRESLTQATGIPAITMAGAVVDALRTLNVGKIALLTPYIEEINRAEKAFFEGIGIEVLAEKGLGISDTNAIAQVTPETVFALAVDTAKKAPGAQALFISCGNLRTIEVLASLEQQLGIPVVSSNQAMLWKALEVCGVPEPINGFGSLLEYATRRAPAMAAHSA
jgi:maleate isomerase